ncbi:hypothetical protein GGS21DRAFT_498854 [Xylaria nigripes]|nr:hypothetical protein GGS21DRAFT_498854 [Xylaria nigripes]
MPDLSRSELLEAAARFCLCLARKGSMEELLLHCSPEILVHEHGLARLAPFLGRDFRGFEGAKTYFEAVGACLDFEGMRFPEFVVDVFSGKVVVRGEARFTWRETGQSWDETFVYVLLFDEGRRLSRYEIWADSGAAYLARRGELGG